jgi:hypothetical protein
MKNCLRLHNDLNVVAEMLAAWGMGSGPPSLKQPLPVVLPWVLAAELHPPTVPEVPNARTKRAGLSGRASWTVWLQRSRWRCSQEAGHVA